MIKTYYPLFLTLALVISLAAYTAFFRTAFGNMETFMVDMMGFFFVIFAFFKLLDLQKFAANFAKYDLLAMRFKEYALLYPFIELALGIAFLMTWNIEATAIVTIVIMLLSAAGVVKAVKEKKNLTCGCMGAVINLPLSTITIVENVGMAAMAVMILVM